MKTRLIVSAAVGTVALLLGGCGTAPVDRVGSGAAIGAGSGAAIGAIFGGIGALPGALIGGALGAGTGAVTNERQVDLGKPVWR